MIRFSPVLPSVTVRPLAANAGARDLVGIVECRRSEKASHMAINMSFESLGQVSIAAGATVRIGWELFEGEFPPLVNHTSVFGFDSARHIVRVSAMDHEGPHNRSFRYSVTNISTGPAPVVIPQSFIFFKVS
jgi:hypothetical protein